MALPAWFASMTQVPTAVNDTVEPLMEHTELAAASIINVTGRPEEAVAVAVYVAPPTVAAAGAVEVNVMVCDP